MSVTESDITAFSKKLSGSSFYAAMLMMPKRHRKAMFAIYMFCRLVDDIADDGTRLRPDRILALRHWRTDIEGLYAGRDAGQASFLKAFVDDFKLRQEDFLAVIDGMEMDAVGDIVAPDFATLDLYCSRVAGAVGRLSARVFGMEDEPGRELAHRLGHALQFTNIMRDLDEDAALGRLYLPRELLHEVGIESDDPLSVINDSRVDLACRKLAAYALEHFSAADRLLRSRPKGRLMPPRLMAAVYGALLNDMLAAGWRAPRQRPRIGKLRLLQIVSRCSVGA